MIWKMVRLKNSLGAVATLSADRYRGCPEIYHPHLKRVLITKRDAYLRKNSSKFAIEEPYITNMTFFTYTRIQEKKDSLVILFGKDGVVKNYGSQGGISELTPF
jgi:hypothetical protein